jgi:NTP pyrophosphatase (non-canonical NTP hydrolase)
MEELFNNAIATRLMLIVSELGEALEALRHEDKENFAEELADVAIRLADLCGGLCIDLEAEILKKMRKNKTREYKHGKAF